MKLSLFHTKSNSSKKSAASPTKSTISTQSSHRNSIAVSPTRLRTERRDSVIRATLPEPPPQRPVFQNPDSPKDLNLLSQTRDFSSELPGLPASDFPRATCDDDVPKPSIADLASGLNSLERAMSNVSAIAIPSSSPLPAPSGRKEQETKGASQLAQQQQQQQQQPGDPDKRGASPQLHWPLNTLQRTSLGSSQALNFAGSPPKSLPAYLHDHPTTSYAFPSDTSRAREEDEVDYGDSPLDQSLNDSPSAAAAQRSQSRTFGPSPSSPHTFDGATTHSRPWYVATPSTTSRHALPPYLQMNDARNSRAQASAPAVEQYAVQGEIISPGMSSEVMSAAERPRSSALSRSESQAKHYSSSFTRQFAANLPSNDVHEGSPNFPQVPTSNASTNARNFGLNHSLGSSIGFSDDVVRSDKPEARPYVDFESPLESGRSQEAHSARRSSSGSSTSSSSVRSGAAEEQPLPPMSNFNDWPDNLEVIERKYASSEALNDQDKSADPDSTQSWSAARSRVPTTSSVHEEEQVNTSTIESTAFFTASSFNSTPNAPQPQGNGAHGDARGTYDNMVAAMQPLKDSNGSAKDLAAIYPLDRPAKQRPRYFKSPSMSYRSISSNVFDNETPDGSGNGIDFALQTGGALQNSLSIDTSKRSRELSRLPSFASNMSSISDRTETDYLRRRKRSLSPLPLPSSESNVDRADMIDESMLATPKAKVRSSDYVPSDTVLAQHVRDVEVPNTIAREYRAMHLPSSEDDQSLNSTPYHNRGKASLSLKEQNSKMDRLSKENFDLKLKIHYLHQALQDRSDEGVKDLISKNAQLQADLIKAKKEMQALRKRIRELELRTTDRDEDLSASRSTIAGSDTETSTRSYRQVQLEDEIVYLRNRMQTLDLENQQLKSDRASNIRPEVGKDSIGSESSRRVHLEVEISTLREENRRLKDGRSPTRDIRAEQQQQSGSSDGRNDQDSFSGSTVVEHLRQANADLRRDLGAQTSMLSSRNRERERLQQEIEDLKIHQRHSTDPRSASSDNLLDRSISRANYTSIARNEPVGGYRFADAERDQYEVVQADLRDENAELKMRIQELNRALQRSANQGELEAIQVERDQALQNLDSLEAQAVEELKRAANEIDDLDAIVIQKEKDIVQLSADLRRREQESSTLHREVRAIKESLNRVVDDSEHGQSTIQHLQKELVDANRELDSMDQKIQEFIDANARLEVQLESSQNEISFLRDEQEGDQIKIGDLESALRNARDNQQTRNVGQEEFDDLQASAVKARDEVRALRNKLSTTEREASVSKHNLDGLETSLRKLFGSEGSGPELFNHVLRLKRDLEHNIQILGNVQLRISEKDRLVRDRDALLESSSLESRRLSDLLDKERQARKHDQNEIERWRKTSPDTPDKRVAELERTRNKEKRHFANTEHRLNAQLQETHALLLTLWTDLAKLCGKDWQAPHALSPSSNITADLTALTANIHAALATLSTNHTTLRARIRATEQDLLTSLSVLNRALDARTKRIDSLEHRFADHARDSTDTQEQALAELSRLEDDNKALRAHLDRARSREQPPSSSTTALATRHADADADADADAPALTSSSSVSAIAAAAAASDQRWVLRLREMESRLRKEREGRLLDREGARKRLEERARELDALRAEARRDKDRGDVGADGAGAGAGDGGVRRRPLNAWGEGV